MPTTLPTEATPRSSGILAVCITVIAAFALRLFAISHLGDLEFDEIVSLRYASLPPDQLLRTLARALFEHPPGYYLSLGFWITIAGPGRLGETDGTIIRILSVLPGVIIVPVAYQIACALHGRRVAIWSAIAVTGAPLLLFYSREARMYALTGVLSLTATWYLLRASDRQWTRPLWLTYTAITLAGLATHYTGPLLLLGHVIGSVIVYPRHATLWRGTVATAVIAGIIAVPWLLTTTGARDTIGFPFNDSAVAADPLIPARSWIPVLLSAVGDMVAGPDTPIWRAWPVAIATMILAAFGVPRDHLHRPLWVSSAMSALAVVLVALFLAKPLQGRYLTALAPMVIISATAGVHHLWAQSGWRRRSAILASTAIGLAVVPFWVTYYGGEYTRADYRTLTRRISALERPGDAVLLTGPWQAWYYDYYYDGGLWHTVLPSTVPPPIEPASIGPRLAQLRAENRRLWFVQAGLAQSDPDHLVEAWLEANTWPVFREVYPNAVLTLYETTAPAATVPIRPATFATPEGLVLALQDGWIDADQAHGGGSARISLRFVAPTRIPTDYAVSIRLVGPDGTRLSTDVPLQSRTPTGTGPPTSGWLPGDPVTINRAMWVPPGTPVSRYHVRIVVYDPATLTPLRVQVPMPPIPSATNPGQEATIGTILVTLALAPYPARAVADERVPTTTFWTPATSTAGARPVFTLLTPDASTVGTDAHPLTLIWGAPVARIGPPSAIRDDAWAEPVRLVTGYRARVTIRDATDEIWSTVDLIPGSNRFDLEEWRPGEWQIDRVPINLSDLPPGTYRIGVTVHDPQGRPLVVGTANRPGSATEAIFEPVTTPSSEPIAMRIGRLRQRITTRFLAFAPWFQSTTAPWFQATFGR